MYSSFSINMLKTDEALVTYIGSTDDAMVFCRSSLAWRRANGLQKPMALVYGCMRSQRRDALCRIRACSFISSSSKSPICSRRLAANSSRYFLKIDSELFYAGNLKSSAVAALHIVEEL